MTKYFLLFAGICLFSMPVMAQEAPDPLEIKNAYAYATAPGQNNGAAFLEITNNTQEKEHLSGGTTPLVEAVQLHTMSTDENGVMMMREVAGFDIGPGETLKLEPSGHHIMLLGLQTNLKEEEEFPLTLKFEKAGELTVNVAVRAAGAEDIDIPEEAPE